MKRLPKLWEQLEFRPLSVSLTNIWVLKRREQVILSTPIAFIFDWSPLELLQDIGCCSLDFCFGSSSWFFSFCMIFFSLHCSYCGTNYTSINQVLLIGLKMDRMWLIILLFFFFDSFFYKTGTVNSSISILGAGWLLRSLLLSRLCRVEHRVCLKLRVMVVHFKITQKTLCRTSWNRLNHTILQPRAPRHR
jgi:hypothetical protein